MMKPGPAASAALIFAFAFAGACAPDQPEPPPVTETPEPGVEAPGVEAPEPGALPAWYRLDGNQVQLDIVAGATPEGNYWNFNGAVNGNMTITVPVGSEVTIRFRNDDPAMAHSIGVAPYTTTPPASPPPEPVFDGAITDDAESMTESTRTGESETITFTADQAGEYSLLCYVPGHGVSGMWVRFNVGDQAGVTGAPDVQITME